jgi:hypothetical protein
MRDFKILKRKKVLKEMAGWTMMQHALWRETAKSDF